MGLAIAEKGMIKPGYFRALAADYDGTLTRTDRPNAEVLEALTAARSSGLELVLVTGRVAADLLRIFPDAEQYFDAIVTENGAVLLRNGGSRALVSPVPAALDDPLVERGIPFQRGQVLLACDNAHEVTVLHEIRRLGLDCQLIRNRSALMVLPTGVSKGTGLAAALCELGVSNHSAIAVGDAENDVALLEHCEIGVAVGNAVDALKQSADVTLTQPDAQGVLGLLRGPLLRGELRVEPRRWQIELGRSPVDEAVRLPASQINLLITGGSGSGKSYAAGLVAERLIELGYSICIFDPEGDHAPLGRLPGVVSFGGNGHLPAAEEIARLIAGWRGSAVVDLSSTLDPGRSSYVAAAVAELQRSRDRTGLPHWIFIDEAHVPLHLETAWAQSFDAREKGFCLVSYRPDEICRPARESFDFLLFLAGEKGLDPAAAATVSSLVRPGAASLTAAAVPAIELGQGVLIRLGSERDVRVVHLGARLVDHVRHWHKYASSLLPEHLRFHFTTARGPTGVTAGNLLQFHRALALCDAEAIERHALRSDFSRWVDDVIQDRLLADEIRSVEDQVKARGTAWLRQEVLRAIESRYLE